MRVKGKPVARTESYHLYAVTKGWIRSYRVRAISPARVITKQSNTAGFPRLLSTTSMGGVKIVPASKFMLNAYGAFTRFCFILDTLEMGSPSGTDRLTLV
ncbi:hypothetical protein [Microbulbifer spongiae]|uniref:Uncharacterized protein n=1 Tax=Microbulbifer spongiae TaxID=2944933 RepID=A0ABY9EFM7_9GAMM|nr:hypothetical protein [Microbulbifer sp. MI-G]WKD50992.1 hypothetical protein M8T91_06120 [Microbulbifer sp. MI-G]